jgi:hypothetical protein
MSIIANLSMKLSSTSLNLQHRTHDNNGNSNNTSDSVSSLTDMLTSTVPWMQIGVAGVLAGGITGFALWIHRRSKGQPIPELAPFAITKPVE